MAQLSDPTAELDQLSPEKMELIREHVKAVLASPAFEGSKRAASFLQLVVERSLAGRHDELRERMIGAEMFGRPIDYDTANDAVVRVKATEVRKRLAQHYHELKVTPPVRIELPSGSYVPRFIWRSAQELPQTPEVTNSIPPELPAAPPTAQEFVTIAQELPDAFAVVLGALQSLHEAPVPISQSSAPRAAWYSRPGLAVSLAMLFLLLTILYFVAIHGAR